MKKLVTILTGIILTLHAYSQENVFYSYITHGSCFGGHDVEILIPFGEKFIYERYRYFYYYTLVENDTLIVDNNILRGKIKTTNFEYIDQECSFCDPKIVEITKMRIAKYFTIFGVKEAMLVFCFTINLKKTFI